ncbi:hypothetical protein UFOVP233_79 [uncultured Caudovirales phage]|uniref:Deoxynucleotide monophosphate kinase n=1 Tax=uncultured Caudovirales phage TaxID=2100421 RepID=A0A6J7WR11_9CAUD|nr:hypothetical protein UFOVP233_79 [uncultured Caudovirales phage]
MILIALTGAATSGKGIVSKRLAQRHDFHACRFAEPIKQMLGQGLGLTHEQIDGREKALPMERFGGLTPRHLMQTLGTEWGRRMVHSDLWINLWKEKLPGMGDLVVVDDLRFPNEAMAVRQMGGIIWRVIRPGVPVSDHPSERLQAEISVDATLLNTSSIGALCGLVDAEVQKALNRA